ncbi:LOW QUALITY PROTEIN: uncharacterized protein CXorf58 homolog [Cariama cristata]
MAPPTPLWAAMEATAYLSELDGKFFSTHVCCEEQSRIPHMLPNLFAGQEFPPFVVFKIFCSTEGQGSRHISGKRIISSSNESLYRPDRTSCSRNKYFPNKWGCLTITSQNWVMLPTKPFVKSANSPSCLLLHWIIVRAIGEIRRRQSTCNLDESPVYFGGRNNCWRRLPPQNSLETAIIYAIMDYAQPKTLSDRLKKELKFLLLGPQNKVLWHDWYRNWVLQTGATLLNMNGWQFHRLRSLRDQSIATEEYEYEAGKLKVWSQALSLEDTR